MLLRNINTMATEDGGDLNQFLKNTDIADHGVIGHQDGQLTGPLPGGTTAITAPSGWDPHTELADAEATTQHFYKWLKISNGDQLDALTREAISQGKPHYHLNQGTGHGNEQTARETGEAGQTMNVLFMEHPDLRKEDQSTAFTEIVHKLGRRYHQLLQHFL